MPRDSQSKYSLPAGTLVSTGDKILVSQHNPPLLDLETAITNSLDRDGKGGMRAPLNMGGNAITNVAEGVNPSDAATVSQILPSVSIPIGAVIDYWGQTPPDDYFFAAGQEISRITYAALFDIIGTAAGVGNGTTTFNLPDYRGRVGAGREAMAEPATTRLNTLGAALGANGGSQTHTLTTAQIPNHTHSATSSSAGGHSHSVTAPSVGINSPEFAGARWTAKSSDNRGNASVSTDYQGDHTHAIEVSEAGGGLAHNNVQPTIIVNKIIKVQ